MSSENQDVLLSSAWKKETYRGSSSREDYLYFLSPLKARERAKEQIAQNSKKEDGGQKASALEHPEDKSLEYTAWWSSSSWAYEKKLLPAQLESQIRQIQSDEFLSPSFLFHREALSLLLEKKSCHILSPSPSIALDFTVTPREDSFFFLHVEANREQELHLFLRSQDMQGFTMPYLFILVEAFATCSITYFIDGERQTDSSSKDFDISFPQIFVFQKEKSTVDIQMASNSQKPVSSFFHLFLQERESEVKLAGLLNIPSETQADLGVRIFHLAPETRSLQEYLVLGLHRGEFSLLGDIQVAENQSNIEGYQKIRGLLLLDGAKLWSRPILHIHHGEVKCSHGSVVGGIDPEYIFYMQSRGIPAQEAKILWTKMLVNQILGDFSHLKFRYALEIQVQKWIEMFYQNHQEKEDLHV